MATQYPSNRSYRSGDDYGRPASSLQPGISRGGSSRGYSGRPASGRNAGYGSRPTGQRGYSQRPAGSPANRRPSAGGPRPSGGGNRRPQYNGRRPRRRAPKGRFFAFIAVAVLLVLLAVIFLPKLFGGSTDKPAPTAPQTTVTDTTVQTQPLDTGNTGDAGLEAAPADAQTETQSQYADISEMLADSESHVDGLSSDQMVQVSELSINPNLPSDWMNILLLGTDERHLSESSRTDAMIICSINRNTGEVKLTNIMRDLAVDLKDIGKYSGTYRINSAAYFGGPNLAMKTVNECFEMNIQYYVMVNFFGFQKIAERLGGVDVEVSEEEKDLINYRIKEQYVFAKREGIDESDLENKELDTFGPNTHLDGRQTLAYARLRKTAGGDYRRAERQQIVLSKLMGKVKTLNALEITTLGAEMIGQVKTNMELNDIIDIALKVASNGIPDLSTFRLPVQNTYKEERRNNKDMLWDCDFAANAIKLYDFIYE